MADHKPSVAELPIRTRRTFDADGEVTDEATVFCPSRARSLDTMTCLDCRYCVGTREGAAPALVCAHPAGRRLERAPREIRMPSAAELTTLTEIMAHNVVCVTADLSIEALGTLLLERNISAVPVVDTTGRAVGVVSKTDLVRWYHGGGDTSDDSGGDVPEPGMSTRSIPVDTVADVMMSMAFTLTEDAPIAHAAALMAVEAVHHLPVVSGDGRVVGIVSSLDIVRWLARHDGFVIPPVR